MANNSKVVSIFRPFVEEKIFNELREEQKRLFAGKIACKDVEAFIKEATEIAKDERYGSWLRDYAFGAASFVRLTYRNATK